MNFSDNDDPIDLSNVNLIEMMLESGRISDEGRQGIMESKGSMSDLEISLEELGAISQFIDQAVRLAFEEVVAMAGMLGQDTVPVAVLREFGQQRSIASKMLWDAADFMGVNMTTDIPDDLSGLEGL